MDPLESPMVYQEACIIASENKFQHQVEEASDNNNLHPEQTQIGPNDSLHIDILIDQEDLSISDSPSTPKSPEEDFTMVQLVEVEDEHFQGSQQVPIEDDGDFTDTGTFFSSGIRPPLNSTGAAMGDPTVASAALLA